MSSFLAAIASQFFHRTRRARTAATQLRRPSYANIIGDVSVTRVLLVTSFTIVSPEMLTIEQV